MNAPQSFAVAGHAQAHESARAQVQGLAPYVDDIAEVRGTLHAAPILSSVAHGRLKGVDARAARAMPGVVAVLLAADIPGDPMLASFSHDEPIFARDTVQHVGQVIGLVVAETVMQARRAARAVLADIEPLPAVLDPRAAHAAQSYVLPPVTVRRGEPEQALARAPHRLSGSFDVGGQEHFYLEGQIAYALPQEQNQWLVYSSTQHPGEAQHWVAHALGVDNHRVRVECRRMGGGFGGKETQSGHLAVWAALAAQHTGRPVKMRLDRDDDFMVTGKRHPFAYDYTAGFDEEGRLTALQLTLLANCGFSADLSGPVADRAVFHSDNAYYLSDVCIHSFRCRTNVQSHTAFRGFGGPQGVIAIETILGEIARHLGLDPLDVRLRNLYGEQERNVAQRQADRDHLPIHRNHRIGRSRRRKQQVVESIVAVQQRIGFGTSGRPRRKPVGERPQDRCRTRLNGITLQELIGCLAQKFGGEFRHRREVRYEPGDLADRWVIPCRRVQTGDVHRRGERLVDGAAGDLVTRLCRSEILQHQCEPVGRFVESGEEAAGNAGADTVGELAVEARLTAVAQCPRRAAIRLCRRQFHDQTGRTFAVGIVDVQPEA